MKYPIIIAYHPTEGFKHIDSIDKAFKGLLCGCYCLKCDEQLIAVVDVHKKIKHFSHRTNIKCKGSQETALHELGKQIIVENSQIALPAIGTISYSNPVAEKRLEKIRPDVSAIFEGQQIFFEIFVTHAVDSGKGKFFVERKHKSVEIDLSDCRNSTLEEIKNIVLNEIAKKKVFYWQVEPVIASQAKKEIDYNWIWKALLAIMVFIILRIIFLMILRPRRA